MNQHLCVSPYLPGTVYIPDGEPHVFGDRLYIYGSHDLFGGKTFCPGDYEVWSTPLSDLSAWKCEGTSFMKTDDPDNPQGKYNLWAPDVCQGKDGRYYLYYCLSNYPSIGVAVSDSPAGPFRFLDHVHDRRGGVLGKRLNDPRPFDPAIFIDDDGSIHLYSGQAPMFKRQVGKLTHMYPFHMELEDDMVTMKTPMMPLMPNITNSEGSGFETHEFFEASSLRKFNGRYYFIYSSVRSHELCYAVSDRPDGGFAFGGVLVSNGDIGLEDDVKVSFNMKPDKGVRNYIGNTHGSVEKIGDSYYVFYHRHTNRTQFARQACAAAITLKEDGTFEQAEMTSQGLGGPLPDSGTYEARIACELYAEKGAGYSITNPLKSGDPYFTMDGVYGPQFIANLRQGSTAVYKYFEMTDANCVCVRVRGKGQGVLQIRNDEEGDVLAEIPVGPAETWTSFRGDFASYPAVEALYFTYQGQGAIDLLDFTFERMAD